MRQICETRSCSFGEGRRAKTRRRLVAVAIGLRAAGIGTWVCWPTFGGAVVGALLWATHTAVASGAWEALVYEQLARFYRQDPAARAERHE